MSWIKILFFGGTVDCLTEEPWPGWHLIFWLMDWNMKLDVVAQSYPRLIFYFLCLSSLTLTLAMLCYAMLYQGHRERPSCGIQALDRWQSSRVILAILTGNDIEM